MEEFDILKTDFHGLRIVSRIRALGSLTRAAEDLGLSQSTLSYTLERMRLVFADPLFVRQGRGVVPTERCDRLVPEIDALLDRFADLARLPDFDPATSTRQVVISCNYYERAVILPALVRRLRAEAPGLRLRVITSEVSGHLQLLRRECDILLSPMLSDHSGLMTRLLLSEHYVCILRRDDPRRAGLTLEQYRAADQIVVNYEKGWSPFYIQHLRDMGIALEPVIELPSFGAVARLMAEGAYVMTVPSALAREFEPTCIAVPAPFDVGFDIRLYWTARSHDTPLNVWLRGHAIAAAQEAVARRARQAGASRGH